MFYIPNNLLTTNSKKTKLGEKKGISTYIMYLAPHTQNSKGINLCPKASDGCAKACLFKSGNARFNSIQRGRLNKSEIFVNDRDLFLSLLENEIKRIEIKHNSIVGEFKETKNDVLFKKYAIRLNGTSDISFDKLKLSSGKTIFETFPNIQFYDYTKNIAVLRRYKENPIPNYHLTFSRSENNENEVNEAISLGFNVAVVFDKLPITYKGLEVLNGDLNDLRFLDKPNSIIGLKYKTNVGKGVNNNIKDNDFIVKVLNI